MNKVKEAENLAIATIKDLAKSIEALQFEGGQEAAMLRYAEEIYKIVQLFPLREHAMIMKAGFSAKLYEDLQDIDRLLNQVTDYRIKLESRISDIGKSFKESGYSSKENK